MTAGFAMKEIEDSFPSDYNPRNNFDAGAYSVDQDFANDDIWDDAPPLEEESSVGQAEEEEAASGDPCVICHKPIVHKCVVIPCVHVTMCLSCGQEAKANTGRCPVIGCNAKILSVLPQNTK